MTEPKECIFCKIVAKESPSHVIWDDDEHLAFLSIFPNTLGATVVIPKRHYPSYVFDLPEDVLFALINASRTVAKLLDRKLEGVGRTALVFEGFGVDHVHAKLFPLHDTTSDSWQKRTSSVETYFDTYPGYVSSHDAARAEEEDLRILAEKIRED